MRILYLILIGVAGGILAGLGMGGGTLTIPLLVLYIGVPQLTAQAVNIISFLPTGSAALFLHFKNGYVETKNLLFIIVPAIVCSVLLSVSAVNINGEVLQKVFGGFLLLIGAVSLIAKTMQIGKIGYLH